MTPLTYREFVNCVDPCESARVYVLKTYCPAKSWRAVYDNCPRADWLILALDSLDLTPPAPPVMIAAGIEMLRATSFLPNEATKAYVEKIQNSDLLSAILMASKGGGAAFQDWRGVILDAYDGSNDGPKRLAGALADSRQINKIMWQGRSLSLIELALAVNGLVALQRWVDLYGLTKLLHVTATNLEIAQQLADALRQHITFDYIVGAWEVGHE